MGTLILPIATLLMAFLLVVLFFIKKRINNAETRIYSRMIIINLLYSIMAIAIFIYAKTIGNNFIIALLQKIYMILMILMVIYIEIYNISILKIKVNKKKILKLFINITALLFIFGMIISPLNVINEKDIIDGDGLAYDILILGDAFYLLIIFITSIAIFINNKKDLKKDIPFIALIFLYVFGFILRSYYPSVIFETYLFTYMLFIMYFTIENPDLKVVNELIKNRELIENQMQDKSDFLFEMSQGIKVPAKNILELTKTYYKLDNQLDKNDVIRIISDNANELIFKTNNILDVSSVDASKINIVESEFDIFKLLDQIRVLSKNKLKNNDIDLRFDINSNIPRLISGDQIRLKQIIMAVISNSINNTKEGFINVSVDSINKYNVARLVIKIEDTGIGMDIEKVNNILDNPNNLTKEEIEKIDKLDVSLSVAIKMIKLLDGNINIKSIPKKGTITTITIDQKYEEENASLALKSIEKYSSFIFDKKKVFLVDSNKEETFVIKDILAKYNVDVTSTLVGKEAALKVMTGRKYDYIIINDELENTSALEVLKELRQSKIKTPVIVMLEKNKTRFKDDYLESGFNEVILKESLTEELQRVLKEGNKK